MFGKKLVRQAHVLGRKINRSAHTLGNKTKKVLKTVDVGLRKAENTLQNKIIPASAILAPQLSEVGLAGLGAVKALRKGVHTGRESIDNIEKHGIRKVLEAQANDENPHSNFG
jgi:hypothetical protein